MSKDTRVISEQVHVSIGSESHTFHEGTAVCDVRPKMVAELERLGLLRDAPKSKEKGTDDGNDK